MAIRDRIKDRINGHSGRAAPNGRTEGTGGFGDTAGFSFGRAIEDLLGFAGDMRGQLKGQAGGRLQAKLEKLAARLELVTRREFEAVRAIAVAARTQAERLEAQLNGIGAPRGAKTTSRKPDAKAKAAARPATKKPGKTAAAKKPVAKKR